jgi:hypothetical protein
MPRRHYALTAPTIMDDDLSLDSELETRARRRAATRRATAPERAVRVCAHCEGRGWTDVLGGIAKVVSPFAKLGLTALGGPIGAAGAAGLTALGLGAPRRQASAAVKERNAIVREVMRENPGMSMTQASAFVKAHNLWSRD